jgi:hypothetical protein
MPLAVRPPEDDDELWYYMKAVWGMNIPRERICKGHKAPFEAFADAYFCRTPISVWKASRGFGGKSTLLGLLTIMEATTLGAQVTVLGGSASQSTRVHEVTHEAWLHPRAPVNLLKTDPTRFQTRLTNGAWILALMASQKSVRGPHPQRLRLDEVDEMEIELFEAAQGQPMDARGVQSQTVISSTHQYPDGTMTELLRRANDKDWPVYEWCWRESLEPHGWLSKDMVERKRHEVSKTMWDTEYDLQEPSFAGRAISTEFVDTMFDYSLGHFKGELDEQIVIEEPVEGATYVTGVDWAKERDWTIVRTFRTDLNPWVEVAFLRTGRKAWPAMVADVELRMMRYKGQLVHDATGLGDVVDDLIAYERRQITDKVLRGREREALFTEYIAGIEQNGMRCPRIDFAHNEHKYVTQNDLFGSGHPPDSFIAGALAWSVRRKSLAPILSPANIGVKESSRGTFDNKAMA